MRRRDFIRSATAAAGLGLIAASGADAYVYTPPAAGGGEREKAVPGAPSYVLQGGARRMKAMVSGMLPGDLNLAQRMELTRKVGFDGLEIGPVGPQSASEMKDAADKAGVILHSVIYGGWGAPMSSADPAVIKQGISEIENALRTAKAAGCDAVLLVPAVVNAETAYGDAYTRSQENIRKVVPLAEELRVIIAIENVWNNFLLSPVEFARYVDEFDTPWVRAYLDCGNMVKFGWAEHWVRALGPRIAKVHLKDFKREGNQFVMLRDGDINWPEVMRAFDEVGYQGWFTTELGGGDEAYLKDVAHRVDLILAGE